MLVLSVPRKHCLGWNDLESAPDGEKQIARAHLCPKPMETLIGRGRLAEEYDSRFDAFVVSANRAGSRSVEKQPFFRKREIARGAQQRVQIAVEVDDGGGAGFLEQVIDVLSQQLDALGSPLVLPLGEQLVRGIRLGAMLLANAIVVEPEDGLTVLAPCVDIADLVDAVASPDTVACTECR